jgi:DNA-binding NarL/FixJ family response regulator
MMRPRVLLAEDFEAVAEQLRWLLEAEFDVVATVEDGYALIGAAKTLRPDVIVADIAMPRLDGISAAAVILRDAPTNRIVLVTMFPDRELVDRAMEIGAMGYVLKLSAGEELVPAVHAAIRGERHLSPLLARQEVGSVHR